MCVFCVRICTALRNVCGFFVRIRLCVCIQLLQFKRLVRTDTSFAYLQRLGDSFEAAMMFVDFSDLAMTVVIDVCQFV